MVLKSGKPGEGNRAPDSRTRAEASGSNAVPSSLLLPEKVGEVKLHRKGIQSSLSSPVDVVCGPPVGESSGDGVINAYFSNLLQNQHIRTFENELRKSAL